MATLVGPVPMLTTRDMLGTIRFYTEVLGFKVGGKWPNDAPCWCSLQSGIAEVMFSTQSEKGREGHEPVMTGRLYFHCDDVLEILDSIKGRVEVIEGPEVHFYGMKEIAIKDNNGYVLVFGQETDEAPTCVEE